MATFLERLRGFAYSGGRWVSEGASAAGSSVYDVLFRQRFTGAAEVQIEDEQPMIDGQPLENRFKEYKAYIVWYSQDNYTIKREISVTYWIRANLFPSESWGEDLLKQAVERCGFERPYSFEEAKGWANAHGGFEYVVAVASFGRQTEELLPSTYETAEYVYTKKGNKIQGGVIRNFYNG